MGKRQEQHGNRQRFSPLGGSRSEGSRTERKAVTQRNEGGQLLRPCLGRLPTLFLPFLVLKLLGLEELVHKN